MSANRSLSERSRANKNNSSDAKSSSSSADPPVLSYSALANKNLKLNKNAASSTSSTANSNTETTTSLLDANRDRFLNLHLSLTGHTVVVHLIDGTVIEGLFHTFTPFESMKHDKNKYVFKACKLVSQGTIKTDNVKIADFDDGSTVIISADKVSNVHAKALRLENAINPLTNDNKMNSNDAFRTDTDISRGGYTKSKNDGFVFAGSAWTTPVSSSSLDTNNNTAAGRKGLFGTALKKQNSNNSANNNNMIFGGELTGSIGKWDQFAANEQKFGIKATFDENLYTTSLDKSVIDVGQQLEAEKIAREIESTATSNLHLAEERGHSIDCAFDEEDLYSSVLTVEKKSRERVKLKLKPRSVGLPEKKDISDPNYAATMATTSAVTVGTTSATTTVPTTKVTYTSTPFSEAVSLALSKQVDTTKHTIIDDAMINTNPTSPAKKVLNHAADADKVQPKVLVNEGSDEKEEDKKPEVASKLNVNTKVFMFNPSAKSFTPGFGTMAPVPTPIAVNYPAANNHYQIMSVRHKNNEESLHKVHDKFTKNTDGVTLSVTNTFTESNSDDNYGAFTPTKKLETSFTSVNSITGYRNLSQAASKVVHESRVNQGSSSSYTDSFNNESRLNEYRNDSQHQISSSVKKMSSLQWILAV